MHNVITAGPSAGKSSVIRELSARGYRTAPEGARLFIDQKISEGYDDADAIREDFVMVEEVEQIDRTVEHRLPHDEIVFLDRALADNIAYRMHFDMDVPHDLWMECAYAYSNVFLLERIDFQDDYARDEDEEEAAEIHRQLRHTYESLGYDIHEIPLMPVDERADQIEEIINE